MLLCSSFSNCVNLLCFKSNFKFFLYLIYANISTLVLFFFLCLAFRKYITKLLFFALTLQESQFFVILCIYFNQSSYLYYAPGDCKTFFFHFNFLCPHFFSLFLFNSFSSLFSFCFRKFSLFFVHFVGEHFNINCFC